MPKMPLEFRFRYGVAPLLTVSMVTVIVALIAILTALDIRRERAIFHDELEERGALMASTLDDVMAGPLYYTDIDRLRDIAEFMRGHVAHIMVFGPDGRLLVEGPRGDAQADYPPTGHVNDQFALSTLQDLRTKFRFEGDSLEVASPIAVGSQALGVVQFGFDADALNAEIREIIVQHVWQGLILIAVGVALSYLIARYATKPLNALATAARDTGRGNLEVPVPARGAKETVGLGISLELMRVELQQLYSGLEQQVAERTQELSRANEGLQNEVSDRQRTEEELYRTRDSALQASRAKSEFLANMSHEIRTPMNAIMGMADLLSESLLTQEQQGYVGVFRTAGETLLTLINDILDLSKVEAGQLDLEKVDFDLGELIENTAEFWSVCAHQKGIELNPHIMPDVPIALVGDPVRLRQVITNLVGNAIKFTERGEVVLHVQNDPGPARPALSCSGSQTPALAFPPTSWTPFLIVSLRPILPLRVSMEEPALAWPSVGD